MVKRHASRKMRKHSKRHHRKAHRRTRRRIHRKFRGGVAPVDYSLAGSWPSRMSLGQGVQYEQLHEGQHGGSAPFPASLEGRPLITGQMADSAMTATLDKAIMDVRGLQDPPFASPSQMATPVSHVGGKFRKYRKGKGKSCHHSRHHSRHHSHRRLTRKRKMRGGSTVLGFDSVNAPGMLLPSQRMYDEAGLNPGFRGADVAFDLAKARDEIPY